MGVSWGGKYAACYCLDSRRASVVSSLTLVAPGLVSRVDLSAMAKLRVAVCAALAPKRLFDIPLNEPELFTDNPRLREYITTDAHRLHKASARFLLASRRMDRMLAAAGDGTLRLPVQLLLAQRDRIINNEATQALLSRLAGERLQVRQFPAAHTIEFEADPQPFYRALMEWLAAHE
jgi:alpha-beta hydrolase superfamily lysophospholipase